MRVGNSYQGFLFSTGAIATATRYTQEHVHTKGIDGSAAVRTTLRHALFGSREQRDLNFEIITTGIISKWRYC